MVLNASHHRLFWQDAYLYYLLACAGGRMSCEAGGRPLAPGRALVFCRSISTARRLNDLLSLLLQSDSDSASHSHRVATPGGASRGNKSNSSTRNSSATITNITSASDPDSTATQLTWAPHRRRGPSSLPGAGTGMGSGAGMARVQLLHAKMQQRQRLKNVERFQGFLQAAFLRTSH